MAQHCNSCICKNVDIKHTIIAIIIIITITLWILYERQNEAVLLWLLGQWIS